MKITKTQKGIFNKKVTGIKVTATLNEAIATAIIGGTCICYTGVQITKAAIGGTIKGVKIAKAKWDQAHDPNSVLC